METSAQSDMPTRALGRTGETVSAIGLGLFTAQFATWHWIS